MNIWLREVIKEDADFIVDWRNREYIRRHCMDDSIVTKESNLSFYENNVLTKKYIQYMVERIDENFSQCSYPIATGYLKNLDYKNKKCELGFFPSDDSEWDGCAEREAIKLLLQKAFGEHGFRKIYTYVFADCTDELALYVSNGFEQEGCFKDEVCTSDGKFRSLVRLARVKEV